MGSVWDLVENCRNCGRECVPEDDHMCRKCSPAAQERDKKCALEHAKELEMVRQFIKDNNMRWVRVE